jgi:hypothetical protein
MTYRKPRSKQRTSGVGFSAPGLRKLTQLFLRKTGAHRDRQPFQDIFGGAIVLSLTATGGLMGAISFGWLGLIVGALLGMGLAATWLESDAFFD